MVFALASPLTIVRREREIVRKAGSREQGTGNRKVLGGGVCPARCQNRDLGHPASVQDWSLQRWDARPIVAG